MARLDARCKVDLPLVVLANEEHGIQERKARFSNISLGGGFIECKLPQSDRNIVNLRYDLPKYGEFEIFGEIIRREKNGVAAKFYNVPRDAKIKLWDYIRENLPEDTVCLYCGKDNSHRARRCSWCGWNLDFSSPNYLAEHEKESFPNRIAARCKDLSIENVYKVLNFIDVEVLGIGKSWEINQEFVGSSNPMLEVFSMIRKVSLTEFPVLITGENGTGKELTAMAIHERSLRKEGPFIPVNCASFQDDLLEIELFGCEKGDNYPNGKIGKFEYANKGTIFLEEIDKVSLGLQAKLLRLLEEKTIEKIGAREKQKVDLRLLTSTSADLRSAVQKGTFRKDLFYRLDSFRINLPPLRERGDDKIILARYFLNKFSREMNLNKTLTKEATEAIKSYDWPGNIREMINKLRRAVVMSSDTIVTATDLGLEIPNSENMKTVASLREVKNAIEKQKLIEALSICNNNISKTAKLLGISRPSIYSLKKKYGI